MSRISIQALRHWIEKRGASDQAPLDAATALALVEAVEAAHKHSQMLLEYAAAIDVGAEEFDTATLRNLAHVPALARFDFGEACGSLYPGGHGEERECVLPRGHDGAHRYA